MPDADLPRGWRLAALALSTVFVLCGVAAVIFAFKGTLTPDFVSYWAAGHLSSGGDAASAYDIGRHHAAEAGVARSRGLLPFAYPPTFLLFLLPFGAMPFWIAFAIWIAVTCGVYLLAAKQLVDGRLALAQPAAAANLVIGQNGFLTTGLFIGGMELLARRPWLAGAVLGLLSFKPQLAALVPVALLAGREWRALGGAVLSACALLALSYLLFGGAAFEGFFSMLGESARWLNEGRWHWPELASPFALLRSLGVAQEAALAVHGVVAIAAAALTVWAWLRRTETRVPILAAASLLISPYLFTYDALLLIVPVGWLLRHGRQRAALAVWLVSLVSLAGYVSDFPNLIPVAAIAALAMLSRSRAHQV